jgi:asparagine synthetase B (glutamine-hydrolysing)
MPILAGWLTGEQVPEEIITQTLVAMGEILSQHGGEPAQMVLPGTGLITFSDTAYAMQQTNEPPVLDWVPDRRTLVYRRPLSGLHPLYYIEDWPAQGNLLFASEIKALFAVGVPRQLQLAALDALLRYGFIPAPWTAFKDIHVVPAGSILRWQHAKTIVNPSTDYPLMDTQATATADDTLDEVYALLDQAASGMLPHHEKFVALTGGGSSSALATLLAAQHTTIPFSIVSIGYKKSTLSKVWKDAEQVAVACQHPFLAITGVDTPEFWTAALAGLEAPCTDTRPLALHELLHTVAAETGTRVALSGLGSNALLHALNAPTSAQHTAHNTRSGSQDLLSQYRQARMPLPQKQSTPLWSDEVAAALQKAEQWEDTLHARKLTRQAAKFADPQQRDHYLDLHLRLPDQVVQVPHQLATQERMVMRSPYLHPDVIALLTRLPATLADGTARTAIPLTLLQRALPDAHPTPSLLPLRGPIASLLHVADSDLLQQTLSPEAIRTRGIFAPEKVEALLQKTGKRQEQEQRELLLVFTTQLLCHLFEASL